jgi:outer membrane protein assembly factor BamB
MEFCNGVIEVRVFNMKAIFIQLEVMMSTVIGSISVDGEQVAYVTAPMDPNESSSSLYALDIRSGQFLWKHIFSGDEISEAVISGSTSFFPFNDFFLGDGSVLIRLSSAPPFGGSTLVRMGCCSGHGQCNLAGRKFNYGI